MRANKKFFDSLNSRKITENKTFWKNIQSFFSEKRKTINRITLVNENEDILSNNKVGASSRKWTVLGQAKKKNSKKVLYNNQIFHIHKNFISVRIFLDFKD